METELALYEVKVKDCQQDCTHTVHEWAISQGEANKQAVVGLQVLLGYDDLEII